MDNINDFIQNIANIWVSCDNSAIEKYYDKQFTADYYGKSINYDDLEKRLAFIKTHQTNRKINILDTIYENNKIAVRFQYSAKDDMFGDINLNIMAMYHINNDHKIIKAWAMSDKDAHYEY